MSPPTDDEIKIEMRAFMRDEDDQTLADHADGRHWKYDTVDGCTFLGCDDAFWRWSFDLERRDQA